VWHVHGLISNLSGTTVRRFHPPEPWNLVNGNCLNWPDYMCNFGFCSLDSVKYPVATAFYITKYVSKELSLRDGDLGKYLYFHSRPLQKAEHASNVYLSNVGLDKICIHDHDFCKTGTVQNASWVFPQRDGAEVVDEISLDPLKPLKPELGFRPWEIGPFYEQTVIPQF